MANDRSSSSSALLKKWKPAAGNHSSAAGVWRERVSQSCLRAAHPAPISLPRTVRGISPSLQPMELVFSQRADSNRDEPADAQDQSRDCTTAAGLAQSISERPI